MKKYIFLLMIISLLPGLFIQAQTSLNRSRDQSIVKEVKQVSGQLWGFHNQVYNEVGLQRFMNFVDQNFDKVWETEPAAMVVNSVIITTRNDLEGFLSEMVKTRSSTTFEIKESHFAVLSADQVLEVNRGEYIYTANDGWIHGPFDMTNTVVWGKVDGKWMVQHLHQSYTIDTVEED